MSQIENEETLFKSEDIAILLVNSEVYFVKNGIKYLLTSHPYEPCLCINKEDKIIKIIHNAISVDEILASTRNNYKIKTISGSEYDVKNICELLSLAIDSDIYETNLSFFEKNVNESQEVITNNSKNSIEQFEYDFSNVRELIEDIFYEEYKKFKECVLDYCIVRIDAKYNGKESHKEAVLFAMTKWQKILKEKFDIDIIFNPKKMKANTISAKDFFVLPAQSFYDDDKKYWDYFLNPPHETHYNVNDFVNINNILFPNGYDNLEIYDWSTDWSNYFDEGLEWWGAKCVSIYDKSLDRFVVISASATD